MDSRTTIQPLGKLYKSYDTLPPGKQSGEGAPCYDEHNAMLGITNYCVPDLNTSWMVETSANTLLPIPLADVQVWTRDGADERWDCAPIRGPSTAIHNRPR